VDATVNKEETVMVEVARVLVVTVDPTSVEYVPALTPRLETERSRV